MTASEILTLTAEGFNVNELAAAGGMTPEGAQMARKAALEALAIRTARSRAKTMRKARDARYRAKLRG